MGKHVHFSNGIPDDPERQAPIRNSPLSFVPNMHHAMTRRMRLGGRCVVMVVLTLSGLLHADPAPFDLSGPKVEVKVTRAGKTLPIAEGSVDYDNILRIRMLKLCGISSSNSRTLVMRSLRSCGNSLSTGRLKVNANTYYFDAECLRNDGIRGKVQPHSSDKKCSKLRRAGWRITATLWHLQAVEPSVRPQPAHL